MSGQLQEFGQRVNELRTQNLNFGPDFQLCIPDADDVKGTFGVLAAIIMRQQNELNTCHSSIKRISDEFVRSQTDMVNWSKKNMEELKKENETLKQQIEDCQEKIKIFSYNLQGYDEHDHPEEEYEFEAPATNESNSIFPIKSAEEQKPDIPSEEDVLAAAAKMAALTLPEVSTDVKKAKEEEVVERLRSINLVKKPERRPTTLIVITEDEDDDRATRDELPTPPKIKACKRWKWALRRVRFLIQMKNLKRSLTKVRLPKGQALVTRIERLENQLFEMANGIDEKLEMTVERSLSKKAVASPPVVAAEPKPVVVPTVATVPEDTTRKIDAVIEATKKLREDLHVLHAKVHNIQSDVKHMDDKVNSKDSHQSSGHGSNIPAHIEAKLIALVERMDSGARLKGMQYNAMVHDLMVKMETLEQDVGITESRVNQLTDTDSASDVDNEKSLPQILKNDTDLRDARGQLLVIDSTINSMSSVVNNVKRDLYSIQETEEMTSDEMESFVTMVNECESFTTRLLGVQHRLAAAYDRCRSHDKVVSNRWTNLTSNNDAQGKLLEAFGGAMGAFSTELQERPTMPEVVKLVDDVVNKQRVQMENQINKMIFKLKIRLVEQETMNEYLQNQKAQAAQGTSTGDGSDRPPTHEEKRQSIADEFEGMLEPLIADIVEMYVNRGQEDSEPQSQSRAASPQSDSRKSSSGLALGLSLPRTSVDRDPIKGVRGSSILASSDMHSAASQSQLQSQHSIGHMPRESTATGRRMRLQRQQEDMIRFMKEELGRLTSKIEALYKERVDLTQIQGQLSLKADTYDVERKADCRVLETVERTLRKVMTDLGDVRNLRDAELEKVKETLEKHVKSKIITLFSKIEDNSKPAFLATKSLCLSCARESSVKMVPEPTHNSPFLPNLNAGASPGPDVYRGGFKMPISQRDGLFSTKLTDVGDEPVDQEELRVEPAAKEELAPSPVIIVQGSIRPTRVPKVITHAGGRDDTQVVQPMHRKGLKGKKSDRAAFMDLNRSLDTQFSVSSPAGLAASPSAVLPSYGQKPKFLAPVRNGTQ